VLYLFLVCTSGGILVTGVMCLSLNTIFLMNWELINLNSFIFTVTFLADVYSCLFVAGVRFISANIFLYSLDYIRKDVSKMRFHLLLLSFVISIFTLVFRVNLVTLILGWDGLGVTSYLLVIYYQRAKSANAGTLTILRNRVGDILIIVSIAIAIIEGTSQVIRVLQSSFSLWPW